MPEILIQLMHEYERMKMQQTLLETVVERTADFREGYFALKYLRAEGERLGLFSFPGADETDPYVYLAKMVEGLRTLNGHYERMITSLEPVEK